jgi:hypothetical protein
MTNPAQSPILYGYASASDQSWSRSEKTAARQAYDAALKRELQEVMQEARRMASKINRPTDVWDLEQYLTERREEIDRKYVFRPSELTRVFGRLLHENRITERRAAGFGGGQAPVDPTLCPSFLTEDTGDWDFERYRLSKVIDRRLVRRLP